MGKTRSSKRRSRGGHLYRKTKKKRLRPGHQSLVDAAWGQTAEIDPTPCAVAKAAPVIPDFMNQPVPDNVINWGELLEEATVKITGDVEDFATGKIFDTIQPKLWFFLPESAKAYLIKGAMRYWADCVANEEEDVQMFMRPVYDGVSFGYSGPNKLMGVYLGCVKDDDAWVTPTIILGGAKIMSPEFAEALQKQEIERLLGLHRERHQGTRLHHLQKEG